MMPSEQTGYDPILLDLFRTELQQHTRVLEEGLVSAEADQSSETLERLMRAAHSIKGAARMLGLEGAVRLAHAMEDVLVAAQRGVGPLTRGSVDVLLHCNDVFLNAAAAGASEIPQKLEERVENIDRLISELSLLASAARAAPTTEPGRLSGVEVDASLLDLFCAELKTHTLVLQDGLEKAAARQSVETLDPMVRAAHSIKGAARMLPLESAAALAHAVENVLRSTQRGITPLSPERVNLLVRCNDIFSRAAASAPSELPAEFERQTGPISVLLSELSTELHSTRPPETGAALGAEHHADKSVRVSAESLNRIVALAGESLVQARLTRPLVSALHRMKQSQINAAASLERVRNLLRTGDISASETELARSIAQLDQVRELLPKYQLEFGDWTGRLEAIVGPLYAEAVASRMRPFGDGTHGYTRMVRDLANELGKKVHFEIEGTATPIDRDILDRLESPLAHLLRNALDHGIETPAERAARGKPPEGRLLLSARQVSGVLRISVFDDGAGIDLPELRHKIAVGGYVSDSIARDLTPAEALEFLFLPGFSTAGTITEVSGRGVGLDAVQSTVRSVGGSVRIQSVFGSGTTIDMQLPLTLSIVRGLLVEICGELYAIPLTRIDRLLRMTPNELYTLEDRQFCTVDGEHVGILSARQVMNLEAEAGSEHVSIVVLSDRLNRYGLAVDRLIGERDLVVKPLPACLGKVANIGAAAFLDDGTPVLILDTDDLVRSMDTVLTQCRLKKLTAPAQASTKPHGHRRILVVDDSITVREVERRLLENRGYEVVVAIDGMEGWNVLQRTSFDLLVTDVDMPRMDGLELIRRVRSAPRIASLPVVIVSYKEQPEHRIKGMEAGANYYLTKSSFHDESLVGAVRDLIGEA